MPSILGEDNVQSLGSQGFWEPQLIGLKRTESCCRPVEWESYQVIQEGRTVWRGWLQTVCLVRFLLQRNKFPHFLWLKTTQMKACSSRGQECCVDLTGQNLGADRLHRCLPGGRGKFSQIQFLWRAPQLFMYVLSDFRELSKYRRN